jgi:hypothetical protein
MMTPTSKSIYNTVDDNKVMVHGTEKNGYACFVYVSTKYPGPIAINATVKEQLDDQNHF